MIFIIIAVIILLISLYLLHYAKSIKVQRTNQANQIEKQKKEIQKLQYQLNDLQKLLINYQNNINNSKNKLDLLHEQNTRINNELQQKKDNISNYYDILTKNAQHGFEHYEKELDKAYQTTEKNFISKIKKIEAQREQVENELNQIKSIYQAATAARLRQQEEQDKIYFYQIQIPDKQIADIIQLQQWKKQLNEPSIVAKIIWSSYIMKPTSDMCNRILGSSNVCGIYKITNKKTGDVYIGQSVNISDRFKQHIKCGLGIDASPSNKLYNNMQEFGVWNFTFEILQKCSRDKLNEKERFWIEMYQSNKVGLNITKGNK